MSERYNIAELKAYPTTQLSVEQTDRQQIEASLQRSLTRTELEERYKQSKSTPTMSNEAITSSELSSEQIMEMISSPEPIDMKEIIGTLMTAENRTGLTNALASLEMSTTTANKTMLQKMIEIEKQLGLPAGGMSYDGEFIPSSPNVELVAIPTRIIDGGIITGYAPKGSQIIASGTEGLGLTIATGKTDLPYIIIGGKVSGLYRPVEGNIPTNFKFGERGTNYSTIGETPDNGRTVVGTIS